MFFPTFEIREPRPEYSCRSGKYKKNLRKQLKINRKKKKKK